VAVVEQQRGLHEGDAPATLIELESAVISCRLCPRLVAWREEVASTKRASFADEDYWGRPVPGFGDAGARIVVVGLAPAAHGANRTGRMFTGDRSGDWLYRSLHTAGLASQASSQHAGDGLTLNDAWITAPVRCAPPQNRPTPDERDNCSGWFDAELALLTNARVFVALGQYGYHALWAHLKRRGFDLPIPRPRFGHGVEVNLGEMSVLCSYHVSQQNTFTGKLTEPMLDAVFRRATELAGSKPS
jgi:uracil-DNA glycosylase family 4